MHSGAKQVDKDLEDKISNTIDTGDEATDGKNSEQKATNDKTRDYVEANEKSSTKFACSMCDKNFKSKEGVKSFFKYKYSKPQSLNTKICIRAYSNIIYYLQNMIHCQTKYHIISQ